MVMREQLLKKLAEDLSRERNISSQVAEYISDHYGLAVTELTQFFSDKLPGLEDYELDLIFSPLYTPTLTDRAGYALILGQGSLGEDEVRQLITDLEERTVYGHFITPQRENLPMALKGVTIQRFVERLYLEKPLSAEVYDCIQQFVPTEDKHLTQTLAREVVWQETSRQQLLMVMLELFHRRKNFSSEKMMYLTDFVRTYRPANLPALRRQLESLIQSCKKDLEGVRGRRFHDAHLKEIYADDEIFSAAAQAEAKAVVDSYQSMINSAEGLLQDYDAMQELMPEAFRENAALLSP